MEASRSAVYEAFEKQLADIEQTYPAIRITTQVVTSRLFGNRTDYIFRSPDHEDARAWATIYYDSDQITVGQGGAHKDFEDFGRGLTPDELAQEAVRFLLGLVADGQKEPD